MGFGQPMHWIVLLLVVVLLFGTGRVSNLMGDVAKGIKAFRKGMTEEDERPQSRIDAQEAARPASETTVHETEKAPR